jgi:NADPH2:quinone reductase
VISTVSSDEKATLAHAAGSDAVVNYRSDAAADDIRRHAPEGVDLIVEVAPAANAALDLVVLAPNGTLAAYASEGGDELEVSVWGLMSRNVRYQFVFVYTVPTAAKDQAVLDVSAAARDGALSVGEAAGLPLHRFPLERTADAHAAVEGGAVGKVLVDID